MTDSRTERRRAFDIGNQFLAKAERLDEAGYALEAVAYFRQASEWYRLGSSLR